MNILLFQPPDAQPAVAPRDAAHGHGSRFVPSWSLQCLRSYLLNRTRYGCEIVDTRFYDDPERQVAAKLASTPDLSLVVVPTSSLGLGPAAAIIDLIRRHSADVKIAICGQHPSQFPEQSDALPAADFAMSGDPEPILRNLVDSLGIPGRLRRIPGLQIPCQPRVAPYWLPDLKSLSLPDWSGIDWGGYSVPSPRQGALAEIRLSRGHSRSPADRAVGNAREPLRIWPFDRAAASIQKCASASVVEIFVGDSPGFWTESRINEWCTALARAHNTQPWSFQLSPATLHPATIRELQRVSCRRVEMIFPSGSRETLARYGCNADLKDVARTIRALQAAGIEVDARIWIGGPEEPKGEEERVAHLLRHLNYCPYSLHAFPLSFDAPFFPDLDAQAKPAIDAWIKWARDPWMAEKPIALWGDEESKERVDATMSRIERAVRNDPRHQVLRIVDKIRTVRIIRWLEDASVGYMRKSMASK